MGAACNDLESMYGTDMPRLRADFLGYARAAAYEADHAALAEPRLRAFDDKVHLYTDGRQPLTFDAMRSFDRDCPSSFSSSS
ncbi:MAG: hypothetical protein JOY61_03505 [Chloroflexi bacterium]|nr:hypothetical protein [Chloroflexota bacterium]